MSQIWNTTEHNIWDVSFCYSLNCFYYWVNFLKIAVGFPSRADDLMTLDSGLKCRIGVLLEISDYIQHPRSQTDPATQLRWISKAPTRSDWQVSLTACNFQHVIECRLIKRRSSCRQCGGPDTEYRCSAVRIKSTPSVVACLFTFNLCVAWVFCQAGRAVFVGTRRHRPVDVYTSQGWRAPLMLTLWSVVSPSHRPGVAVRHGRESREVQSRANTCFALAHAHAQVQSMDTRTVCVGTRTRDGVGQIARRRRCRRRFRRVGPVDVSTNKQPLEKSVSCQTSAALRCSRHMSQLFLCSRVDTRYEYKWLCTARAASGRHPKVSLPFPSPDLSRLR